MNKDNQQVERHIHFLMLYKTEYNANKNMTIKDRDIIPNYGL